MLVTISTTSPDGDGPGQGPVASDLGYVLHKHPDNVRSVDTTGGRALVFWPKVEAEQATVALMVDVDPIALVRRGRHRPLAAYVNDRPYVASSLLAVAMGKVFRTAMAGRCENRPELVDHRWPVEVHLPAVPIGGDRHIIDRLFQPLGYEAEVTVPPLDDRFPQWGPAAVASVTLSGRATMADLLRHLYVLLPVLDADKHYWIDETEISKLIRQGEGWLPDHPARDLIARRYLGNHRDLATKALELLDGADGAQPSPDGADGGGEDTGADGGDEDTGGDGEGLDATGAASEAAIERPLSLNEQRLAAVTAAVSEANPASVVDLGCGEGNLLALLADEPSIERVVGADPSSAALRRAERRLNLRSRPERQRPQIELRHSSLTYRDRHLAGFDVALLIEVIEHIDPGRLDTVEPMLFEHLAPRTVIVTTPNRDYNALFDLPEGQLRHRDHRFEWTRHQFQQWCLQIQDRYGYDHRITGIGSADETHGSPTQMAVMTRSGERPRGSNG